MNIRVNHALQGTYRTEFHECSFLVGKIIIGSNGNFSDYEIKLAERLLKSGIVWRDRIVLFLNVIAGSRPNVGLYDECYAALTTPDE